MPTKVYLHQVIRSLLCADVSAPTQVEEANKAAFLGIWPGLENDIDEYRKNHNCSCRFKLMEAMRENRDGIQAYLRKINKQDEWQVDLSITDSDRGRQRSARGFVRDIDDSEEAFMALLVEMTQARLRFMGLTVRDIGEGKIRVYFY